MTNSIANKGKISVIIPARNEEKYIEFCINSVKSQNFSDYEIIVVDNGSTDKTSEIAKKTWSNCSFRATGGTASSKRNGQENSKR